MPTVRGKAGRGSFPRRIEESLGFQPLFELFKGELQRSSANRLNRLANQLQLPALRINADASADQHVQSILRA